MGLYINSNTAFMLARKNPNDFRGLTAMDILSTEAMSRESIGAFIDRLIDPKNLSGKSRDIFDPKGRANSMNKKAINDGKVHLINTTYQFAVLFVQLLGIQLRDSQIRRKFDTVEEFKEHVYRIKPELNEPDKKDDRYVFERKNGVGMIIECALIRAMDHTYDTLSSNRFGRLDQESSEILKKIKSIRRVQITNENESGFDIRYNHPDRYFEGHVFLRKKNFFKILLKMAYNRRYGEAEAMKDLLGMRYETLNPNQENMANAVIFFQREVFDEGAKYEQKGGLLDVALIREKGIDFTAVDPRKKGTNSQLKNGDITGTVSRKEIGSELFTTGNIEMQFQNVGGMENGYNKTEVYELKKFLSAASRILMGFDIRNLKFFIQVFAGEETGLSEKSILHHLFFPTEGWEPHMSPNQEIDGDEADTENFSEQWVSRYWDSSHGFILPLKSRK
jgi:hypothetical protein